MTDILPVASAMWPMFLRANCLFGNTIDAHRHWAQVATIFSFLVADVSGVSGIVKRCLICEDHALLANVLALTVAKIWPRIEIVQRNDFNSALDLTGQTFSLAIIDLGMSDSATKEGVRQLIESMPHTPFLVFAGYASDNTLMQIMELGVSGLVDKSSSAVVIESAIRLVGAGERYFSERILRLSVAFSKIDRSIERSQKSESFGITDRQKAVLNLVARGYSNKEIGHQLGISSSTVKTHVEVLISKFSASNRTQISVISKNLGII